MGCIAKKGAWNIRMKTEKSKKQTKGSETISEITLISLPRTLEIYLNEATQSKKWKPQHQRYEVTMSKERCT